jgi:ADP-heptose:LPS heptosyltransferase
MKKLIRRFIISIVQEIGKLFYKYNNNIVSNNILLIRLDEIGDVVMMSPLLRELRRNYPIAKITLVVKPQVYNLVELCPYVDEVLIYKKVNYKFGFIWNIIKAFCFSMRYLWQRQYDLAIVPRWDDDRYFASWIAFFSGAKQRVGYSEKVNSLKMISNYGYDGFFTGLLNEVFLKHEVERNLAFIEYLGGKIENKGLEVWTNEDDKVFATERLQKKEERFDCIRIAVFLSAGGKRKEWDVANFVLVLNRLKKSQHSVEIILLGAGENTEYYGEIVMNQCKDVNSLIGKTTLRQTIEILKGCQYYFGGDTGPMHLAAACKLDGLVLFLNRIEWRIDGLDTPERFGPWQSTLKVVQPQQPLVGCSYGCQKNYAHCINQITVDEVYKVLENEIMEKIKNEK